MSPVVAPGIAGLLVLANGFFVAVEFAPVRLRKTQVDAMAADGNWRGRLVQTMHRHIDAYLADGAFACKSTFSL